MLQAAIFYLFASILTLSALMVISVRNPVHAVLFLILAFFNAAGLFIMLGAEFIGMILVIVYVGAVAVLFLFVVMMLDVDFQSLRKSNRASIFLGSLLGMVLLAQLVIVYQSWTLAPGLLSPDGDTPDGGTNTEALAAILYTDNIYAFQGAGLILLVAMIGAIVLTLRHRTGVRRQNVSDQQARRPKDVLEMKKVPPGTGTGV